VATTIQAGFVVLPLFLPLVLGQNLFGFLTTVTRRIGIRHPDIENRRRPSAPKAVSGHIASAFGKNLCAGTVPRSVSNVLT
jgi:hypothetical protein